MTDPKRLTNRDVADMLDEEKGKERARVVRFLRNLGYSTDAIPMREWQLADAIERGEHDQ